MAATIATAVSAEALRKRYPGSDEFALDGFELSVPAGTVHGLLGPNGAGKTTAVRILATLLRADGGRAVIDGLDVATHAAEVRRRIGLVGQYAAVDEILDGRRNLVMFGRLFHLSAADARRRADEFLERFDLAGTGSRPIGGLSRYSRRCPSTATGR
jgi:ABC-2 type transport system ATP-binding protein